MTLFLATLLPPAALAAPAVVRDLDASTLSGVVGRQKKYVVLMYDGACEPTKLFQPWYFALANQLPHLPMAQIDVAQEGRTVEKAFQAFANGTASPAIKLLVRDNPVGQRVVNYGGLLEYDALLGWMRAMIKANTSEAYGEHPLSSFGVEPPETPQSREARERERAGGGGSMMDKLPASVRRMAETMVRETRMQKILREMGGGREEQYTSMVSERFQQIVAEEKTDTEDKFAVQEANRRARDQVREELLATAPDHVRAEIEGEVSLGDMAGSQGGGGGSAGTQSQKAKAKRKAAAAGKKDEL